MKMSFRSLRHGAVALTALAALPAVVSAQDLPPAEEVIDRYVEAIGGRDAALQSMSARTVGSFSMPAMGVTGDLTVLTGEDGQMYTSVTIPGMGEMRSGYTGEVGWSVDPLTGPRLLDGAELDAMREQADDRYAVRDPALFTSVTTVGENEYDGEACWEVAYVWVSGRESSECFSKETGLLIASTSTQESPMGSVDVVTRMSDYQQFGDLFLPTTMRQSAMGQEQVMTIESVEFGTVDASDLEPPAAILTLINSGG
ncbi:MAG TPA: hypothetical protein VJ925_07810 [Longimicrobiales bacterium]|nr:hypothetical protein [Longimicrobiales bacterium]